MREPPFINFYVTEETIGIREEGLLIEGECQINGELVTVEIIVPFEELSDDKELRSQEVEELRIGMRCHALYKFLARKE